MKAAQSVIEGGLPRVLSHSDGLSTAMPADRIRPGSIGRAGPHNEVKLDPATGELLMRGPNVFMGNQPEKTAETNGQGVAAYRRRRHGGRGRLLSYHRRGRPSSSLPVART